MTSHFLFLTGSDSNSIIKRLDKLKDDRTFSELYISLVDIDESIGQALVDVLKKNDRPWDGIHLAHCTGRVDVVISNALALGSVNQLSLLPDRCNVDEKCLTALTSGLQLNKSTKSLVIRVNLYKELALALAQGLASNSVLEELSLLLSNVDKDAINLLATGIRENTNLRSLKLNRCRLEDGHVADLVRALESHPHLLELSVQARSCRSEGILSMSGLIKSDNKILSSLDLSNQQFDGTEIFGVSYLASCLPANKTLAFLDLSSNHLSDEDLSSLASALTENSSLKELRLVSCGVSDKGATALARYIPKMVGLKTLWLYGNPFGREGARQLEQAIQSNVHLEHVLIPRGRSKTMDEIQAEIEYFLILNRGGRKLLQKHNIPPSIWPLVLHRAGSITWEYFFTHSAQTDVLYHLLQGPAILNR